MGKLVTLNNTTPTTRLFQLEQAVKDFERETEVRKAMIRYEAKREAMNIARDLVRQQLRAMRGEE